MSFSLFPPKFRHRSRASLYLIKALLLFSLPLLSFLIMPNPAQAQGNSWAAVPCNAAGTPLSDTPDSLGYYHLNGTESGTTANSYAYNYGAFSPATAPGVPSMAIPTTAVNTGNGIGGWISTNVPDFSNLRASNSTSATGSGGYFYYTIAHPPGSPTIGIINGGGSVSLNGQLAYYFKEVWQGAGVPTPMPTTLPMLLKTTLLANAIVVYNNSLQTSGLSASATATDGPPFNETAFCLAGDAGLGGVPSFVGYHLVTSGVDPATHIATVFLNGSVTNTGANTVPYGTAALYGSMVFGSTTNGATNVFANASVVGGVKIDGRLVTISCPAVDTM